MDLVHILCHDVKEEARRDTGTLIERSNITCTGAWANMKNNTECVGQKRANDLAGDKSLWNTDTLWMGVNRVRAKAGTSLVGTPGLIAAALKEYVELGVVAFIFSGWPHIEEAERFGRDIMPLVKETDPTILEVPTSALAS